MEKLLKYFDYNQLLCVYFTSDGRLQIIQSSNRAVMVERVSEFDAAESLRFNAKGLFVAHFRQCSTNGSDSLESDKSSTSQIIRHLKKIKETLVRKLDSSQLVFALPVDWSEDSYQDGLRALFVEAEWIKPNHDDSKLIFVPFAEVLFDYIQRIVKVNQKFEREKKYLLCFLQWQSSKEITINTTCLQMQSAKELTTFSKKLATSDFLLIPTVKSNRSISLSRLDSIIRDRVIHILTSIEGNDSHNMIERTNSIVDKLHHIYISYKNYGPNGLLIGDLPGFSTFDKQKLGSLISSWSCNDLITIILRDTKVQDFLNQSCSFIKDSLQEYGINKGSPDGIQDIILYNGNALNHEFSKQILRDALVDANIVQTGNYFVETPNEIELCTSAVQRPLKLIQIGHAILPPLILDGHSQHAFSAMTRSPIYSNFVPVNTFYIYITIDEQRLHFLLNKVVKLPSINSDLETFTAQEEDIEIRSIIDAATENLWSYYQSLVLLGHNENVFKECCQEHKNTELLFQHYTCFSANLKALLQSWIQEENILVEKDADSYQSIPFSHHCECALNISHRILFDVGLKPAIKNIAATITGTLFSQATFGLYHAPVIMISSAFEEIRNSYYRWQSQCLFKKSVLQCMVAQKQNPLVRFVDSTFLEPGLVPYSEHGRYSQLSDTSYMVGFEVLSIFNADLGIVMQHDGDSTCKRLEAECERHDNISNLFKYKHTNTYLIMESGDCLKHLSGTSKRFILPYCNNIKLDIYAINAAHKTTSRRRILSEQLKWRGSLVHPITVNILPQTHLSSVKISISYVAKAFDDSLTYFEKSLNVPERLCLIQEVH
ncbi:hypothetical protein MBANPS3_002408 [Mucor bainieri]